MAKEFTEKRNHRRVPLDSPLFIAMRMLQKIELPVQLIDCSRGGVQVAFPPAGAEDNEELLNSRVELMGLPRAMDPLGENIGGVITWVGAGRCGVRFEEALQITEGEIREVAEEL